MMKSPLAVGGIHLIAGVQSVKDNRTPAPPFPEHPSFVLIPALNESLT